MPRSKKHIPRISLLEMMISITTDIVVESRKLSFLSMICTQLTIFSYRDVVIRLEPIIMELERSEDILIVTHQAVLRCIYAYFMKKDQRSSPWLNVPLHTLIKLTPRAYGTVEEFTSSGISAVSTWRGQGSVAKHEDPTDTTVSLGTAWDGEAVAAKG
jgi:hypothetical protein